MAYENLWVLGRHMRAARDGIEEAEEALSAPDEEASRELVEAALAAARHELELAESSLAHAREDGGPAEDGVDTLVELDRAADRARPVDPTALEALREMTAAWAREFTTTPPPRLLELVRAHVDRTAAGLDRPLPPVLRARLAAVASETASLAGWVLLVGGRPGEAHAHFSLAATVARDVGDPTRHALALGSMASLCSTLSRGTGGGSAMAVRLLRRAVGLVRPSAPVAARGWLHGRLAVEAAALGDATGFGEAIADAHAVTSAVDLDTDDDAGAGVFAPEGVLSLWGPERTGLRLSEGLGAGLLGDERGLGRLERVLDHVETPVDRTQVLGDTATVAAGQGHADLAVARATELFDVAVEHELFGRLDRVRGLRARLPDHTPGIPALDARLRGAGAR